MTHAPQQRRCQRIAVAGLLPLLVTVAALAFTRGDTATAASAATGAAMSSPVDASTGPGMTAMGAGAASAGSSVATASTGLNAGLTVEPRVPRAAGTPCEVVLFTDEGFIETFEGAGIYNFTYAPPSGCPRPWSKVVLELDLSGPRSYASSFLKVGLGNSDSVSLLLFQGAPQEHEGLAIWRVERDLTEYASALTATTTGFTVTNWDNASPLEDPAAIRGTARIKFYPATAKTPAPRVAHAVYPINQPLTLPRNIVRAYVDVIAQQEFSRFWYTCVPSASFSNTSPLFTPFGIGDTLGSLGPPDQGCGGGSFRQADVSIDGQPAGIAQVYPWLPSLIHRHTRVELDYPAPSVQALNFMPYRVDLTPFAALLSDGAPHTIEVRPSAGGEPSPPNLSIEGNLLVYRDLASPQVTGAVTRNTLTLPLLPVVTNGLAQTGDVVQGTVDTRLDRRYVIEGYVDTSRGRIRSSVHTHVMFTNTQDIWAAGTNVFTYRGYVQALDLNSTVDRVSRRVRGGVLLSEDREHICYPLKLNHRALGVVELDEIPYLRYDELTIDLNQARIKHGDQYRHGAARYQSKLYDRFIASMEETGGVPFRVYDSKRSYLFKDSRGSCYSARLTTLNKVLASYIAGAACPDGMNRVRWFAHPDGSPDNLGWTSPLPL